MELLYFSSEHIYLSLVSLIPALIALLIFIYVLVSFPTNVLSKSYLLLIFCCFMWQSSEGMIRLSGSIEVAQVFNRLMMLSLIGLITASLLFALRLANLWSNLWLRWSFYTFGLFGCFVFFLSVSLGLMPENVLSDPTWNYISRPGDWRDATMVFWIAIMCIFSVIILTKYWLNGKTSDNRDQRKSSTLIFTGFVIPAVFGVLIQLFGPYLLHTQDLPVTNSLSLLFIIGSGVAIRKYNFLPVTPQDIAKQLVENIHEGVFVTDNNDRIQYANFRFCNLLQVALHEIKNRKLIEVLRQLRGDERLQIEEIDVPTEGDRYEGELNFKLRDGTELCILHSSAPFRNDREEIAGRINITMDITYLKEAEGELRSGKMELEQINEEMKMILHRATHDIKGPLASLIGLTRIGVREIKSVKDAKHYFDMINQTIFKLNDIIDELSDLNKIKNKPLNITRISILQTINEILDGISYLDEYAKIDVQLKMDTRAWITSDWSILHSILQNLIVNAIVYSDRKKKDPFIRIESKRTDKGLNVVIQDNGKGIPQKVQQRVFDMFYRATTDVKGSGLGLYLVKTGIQKLGGSITLFSVEKEGTTFTLYIPDKEILEEQELAVIED